MAHLKGYIKNNGIATPISGFSITAQQLININDDHSLYLTEHPSITLETDVETDLTPSFGDEITVVSGIEKDDNGHVTKITVQNITLPDSITVGDGEDATTVTLSALVTRLVELEEAVEKLNQVVMFKASTETELEQLVLEGEDALDTTDNTLIIKTEQASVDGETITFNSLGD